MPITYNFFCAKGRGYRLKMNGLVWRTLEVIADTLGLRIEIGVVSSIASSIVLGIAMLVDGTFKSFHLVAISLVYQQLDMIN